MNVRQLFCTFQTSRRQLRRSRNPQRGTAGIEVLETRQLLAADVSVLKDIIAGNTDSLVSAGNGEHFAMEYNGFVYFTASDGTHGLELWRTDGTQGNTAQFMDLRTGIASSVPSSFFVANGKLFFNATASNGSRGLYVTDGTLAGTTLLTTLRVDTPLGAVGSTVYYYKSALMSTSGEFWKTDGTPAGTLKIANGFPESEFGSPVVFDGTVFFSAKKSLASNTSLWKINTANDTIVEVATSPLSVSLLTVSNGKLYFTGSADGSFPTGLWKMDSAAATPTEVQANNSVRIAQFPEDLTDVNGTLFFTARTTAEGRELWQSDGTSAGTVLVKDINPGSGNSAAQLLTAVGQKLYFAADDGTHGNELWSSDGTEPGTVLVKDIISGATGGDPRALFNLDGLLIYTSPSPQSALPVLWTSDGTDPGTTVVNNTVVNLANNFVKLGTSALFAAENTSVGREMFILRVGTQPAAPVLTGPASVTASLRPAITWNAVGTSTEYEVWINNRSTNEFRVLVEPASGTSFTPSIDLRIGNFTVWVRTLADNGGPPSVWSVPRTFRINTAVTQNPVGHDSTNGLSMLSWQQLKGAAKYDVWIDRLDVPTAQIFRDTNVVGTSVTPPSLPNNGRYRVWVRGLAADGADGAWSASQDFVAVQVPAITSGLNPTFDTAPTVAWTAVPGAASYEVYVLSINGNFKALHQKNIAGTTFTWPTLPAGPYRYWVRTTGATIWSNPVDIDTSGRTNVLTPIGSTTAVRPVISWRPVDEAVRYELWVNRLGVQDKIIYQTGLTSTSFTPTFNLPSGNYRVWVRAVSSTLTAPWSVPVDFTIVNVDRTVEPQAELLASVFADSELLPLLDGTEHSTTDVSRTVTTIPVAPPDESESEFVIADITSLAIEVQSPEVAENLDTAGSSDLPEEPSIEKIIRQFV